MARVEEAATHIGSRLKIRPSLGIVLGSGLGAFADSIGNAVSFPYAEIPHFPRSTVSGHSGRLLVGTFQSTPLFVMAGRVHAYEGYSADDVVFPVRVMATLGLRTLVVTNAAGAVNTAFRPADLMLISDHLNLTGRNPLAGKEVPEIGSWFIDMTEGYDSKLVTVAEQAARRIGLNLRKGVYAGLLGPSYETPAEIRMLRTLGADAVGMSTVLETIAANHMKVKVVGISCITNMAAGVLPQKLDHREVLQTGERVRSILTELLERLVPALAKLS